MSKIQKLFQISTELVNATITTVLNPIPELAAAAAAEVMIALASGFLGIDDSKSWSRSSSSSYRSLHDIRLVGMTSIYEVGNLLGEGGTQ